MLYTVAYDVLREKEEKLLIDGDSESLADYLNAFEFMKMHNNFEISEYEKSV